MIEVALVFDGNGENIFWHKPEGCTSSFIPDSRSLWDVLWDNRENLGGVCHIHPFDGPAWPSFTDVTTFAAVEAGLGRRLIWPIITMTDVKYFGFNDQTNQYGEIKPVIFENNQWKNRVDELREQSKSTDS